VFSASGLETIEKALLAAERDLRARDRGSGTRLIFGEFPCCPGT
jgi:hypothetical protein